MLLRDLQPCHLPCQGHSFFIHIGRVLGVRCKLSLPNSVLPEVGLDGQVQALLSVSGFHHRQNNLKVTGSPWSPATQVLNCGSHH